MKARKIVGISLSPEVAIAFKGEAERRGITAKHLFEELWAHYSPPRPPEDRRVPRTRQMRG